VRLDLSGRWAAVEATDALRRDFVRPELDDRAWQEVRVPGHWRDEASFSCSDGPLLYRKRFEAGMLMPGERAWLVMEGVFYEADVWLDGSYLGDTEGYFFPHCFEVTALLRERGEHLLAVEVACPRPPGGRALLGAWADPGCVSPSYNPGGIWAPVRVVTSGPVRLAALRAACLEARQGRAVVELAARLDALEALKVDVEATLISPVRPSGTKFTWQAHLAAGPNSARWRAVVPEPELWWPAGLGGQPLYEVAVSVLVRGAVSDSRSLTTGLRQVRARKMTWELNGERVFLQGAELVPTGRALAAVSSEDVARDVAVAREAGLNLLRVKQHVGRPELYRAADQAGMLLWQDLPLPGRWSGKGQAVRQAREAVWLLAHHPSIVAWCGGGTGRGAAQWALRGGWATQRAVKRATDLADGSRPALAHVPGLAARLVSPGPGASGRGGPRLGRLERAAAIWPGAARLVAGVGAASSSSGLRPERWPQLDAEMLRQSCVPDKAQLLADWPPERPTSFDCWSEAAREAQAEFVRSLVEGLRRLRSYPVSGFVLSRLNDAQECFVSSSLVDYERRPKPAFAALGRALAPLLPVASGLGESYRANSTVRFSLWVLNAQPVASGELELLATLAWPGGGCSWRFAGVAPAGSTSLVARKATALPGWADFERAGPRPWQLRLELVLLRGGNKVSSNAYARPLEPGRKGW